MTVERNRIKMVDMLGIRKIVGTLLFLVYFDIFSDCWSSQLATVLLVAAVYLDNMLLLWWRWRWCVLTPREPGRLSALRVDAMI